ncbi:MAG: ribonuclease E/G [Alphaproteobacteria bacterium]|nr:ribonuclease E/G [Alphaproteobacteria bacterium]
MAKKMLVDASHPEETRVVVLDGNRVEEFDYESASRRPLKGNIYLAKVTRVEPSLQACFIEYGGNRHGFLAFSEIHPDYYQIPTADRQALLEATRAAQRSDADEEDSAGEAQTAHVATTAADEAQPGSVPSDITMSASEPAMSFNDSEESAGEIVEVATNSEEDVWVHDPETEGDGASPEQKYVASNGEAEPHFSSEPDDNTSHDVTPLEAADAAEASAMEASGGEDAMEELPRREHRSFRRYKIQEVIKRRQVLLVQVVKEERGNKGAALTTYLSLAGRYCVLMPNTDRGGGISRKISNVADRRKLKEVAVELEVPEGMGVIIRTAGANRTKQEIKRDFEYLMRQWDAVRDLTLRSSAPTVVYEEGNLIKRTIRDLYSKDVDDIWVEGEQGFKEAHGFMTMLMPSHADSVKPYRDPIPLYQRYGVETALDSMFNPIVRLRSGGYIVINQTEALVAVDVNSGKSTREHHIEDTALKTNLEASEEVARQLRLRDLAGLVVIDFIDMEEHRNNRAVEKRLKDCLRHDRARIQLGRISPFGLLEMSRQRLRAGMVEGATISCPHCEGRGVIRSVGSMALRVLRAVEEYCQREKLLAITLRVPPEIALYILNHKRAQLTAIEDRHAVYIYIESKPSLTASTYEIERGTNVPFEPRKPAQTAVTVESELEANDDLVEDVEEDADGDNEAPEADDNISEVGAQPPAPRSEQDGPRRKRRRRRGGRDREHGAAHAPVPSNGPQPQVSFPSAAPGVVASADANDDDGEEGDADEATGTADGGTYPAGPQSAATGEQTEGQRRRRRRGRRGRRGRRPGEEGFEAQPQQAAPSPIGRLPTPAEALDAPNWPATGGYDTVPGERPVVARDSTPQYVRPAPRVQSYEPSSAPVEVKTEAKVERPSIASFFGFGGKPEDGNGDASTETKPERKGGWWQKKTGG